MNKNTAIVSVVALLVVGVVSLSWLGVSNIVYAQDGTPVITPTLDAPVDPLPPLPDEPVPIPPTLLELLKQLLMEGAGWLTGIVLLGLGIAQKWLVAFVRKLFPNDKKTATKVNGGLAEIVSGVTSVGTALIAFGVLWATNFVGSLDLTSLLELAGLAWGSGFGVHKLNKLASIAKALKASS